ncbi:MAG TPA: WD40 repeat domain-containing serine/threonine protein kinase [Anaerolineales bacterium]|nr:WD40 repeat domain-containing serine/threonine protein kinase [Anaerolineales bacterium]
MKPVKIGRYEIKSELGRGGMATVYRGYDPRFEREVAIKVLPPEMLHADPQFKYRFEREAKIIAQLEHRSIVPVYDVGEENDQPYFVMRYMSGGSLSERIKKTTFSIEEATRILDHISPGMDEAHSKGIIHRDLKPGNILFDNKDIPHISDFGIAKITEAEARNVTGSAIIGTPAYMAPEQASGDSIDGRVDIYALGVLLYEMLTGKQPYEADTPMGVAIKHVTEPVPHILNVNPSLPPWIEMIISTAMAKDKNDRFSTAVEMTETIKAFLRGEKPLPSKNKTKSTIKVSPSTFNKTIAAKKPVKEKRFNPLVVIVPVILIGLIGSGIFLLNRNNLPFGIGAPSDTPTSISSTATSSSSLETTNTPSVATETETPPAVTDTPAASLLPVLGGADKIAFLKSNDVWVMNVDGSDLHAITNDGAEKFNLEWLPDGKTVLYITGKTIKTVEIDSQREEIITNFSSSEYFESFHVSPDGKQVAISLARELHVVDFDVQKLKSVTKKSALLDMQGCLYYKHQGVLDAIWSADGQKLTIKYIAPFNSQAADTLSILDIHQCNKAEPERLDEFPLNRFPFSTAIVNYDWDGDLLFLMNSNKRNGGFGELAFYNTFTHKSSLPLPIDRNCCYRDATFSPDGTYVLFAFQDIRQTDNKISLYYVPLDSLTTGGTLEPMTLPDGFFTRRNDAPMPDFRPAQ